MAESEQATGSRQRLALGRGLDALLASTEHAEPREVDIDRIERNPNQPRQRFERAALEDLADSIRQHGIVQPLVVIRVGDDRYQLIVGERRWQAARLAGVRQVPVVVREAGDRESLEMALIENLQRADLNPLEEATAYQRLTQDFGLTQQQVAEKMGKTRVTITNTIRLLALPETLKRAVVEGRISEGHARAMLGLARKDLQLSLLDRVEREGLTVRQTEQLVRRLQEGGQPKRAAKRDADVEAFEGNLRRSLGTKVVLRPGKRGGRIVIEYYSDEELDQLYRRLLQA